jgi:hypothetical protein
LGNARRWHHARRTVAASERNRESVDRLFRLGHASRLDQIEAAFHALGRSIAVLVEAV